MARSELDSVTVDIIGHNLVAIAEEMGIAMMRAAYSLDALPGDDSENA